MLLPTRFTIHASRITSSLTLFIEPEVHEVVVLHHILFEFQALLARAAGERDPLLLGVFIAAGTADRGVRKPEGRHHDTCDVKSPHLLTSVLPPNFCSFLLFPEMISMTKGISFGEGAAATTGTGRFGTARGRGAAISDGSGVNLPLLKRRWSAVPGVLAMSWSNGFRRTSWMLVWLAARLSCSACVGVTSMFTTCTAIGLPSASFLKSWPAEGTSMFCSKSPACPPPCRNAIARPLSPVEPPSGSCSCQSQK